jgi:hypothetical protein
MIGSGLLPLTRAQEAEPRYSAPQSALKKNGSSHKWQLDGTMAY